jgi:hypothetical protein
MAYTQLEISQIESIMTEEEKFLYTMLVGQRQVFYGLQRAFIDDDVRGICEEAAKDLDVKYQKILTLVAQRISLKSKLTFCKLTNHWCKYGVGYTGIAYQFHKNGMIEFYTDKSEAISRQKTEEGIIAYKMIEGDEMYVIPNSVLEYVKEDKTYKLDIGLKETLMFNLGRDNPFAIVINESGDLVYTYTDIMFEVSQFIKDSYPKPVEISGVQCSILEKSL